MKNPFARLFAHTHETACIGVQTDLAPVAIPGSDRTLKITIALFRCMRCGQVWSQTLNGHWTMDQVQGRTAAEVVNSLLGAGGGR